MPVNQESNLAVIAAVNLQRSGTVGGRSRTGSCRVVYSFWASNCSSWGKIKQIISTPSSWGLGKVFLMVRKCMIMTLFLHRGRFFPPVFLLCSPTVSFTKPWNSACQDLPSQPKQGVLCGCITSVTLKMVYYCHTCADVHSCAPSRTSICTSIHLHLAFQRWRKSSPT